MPDRDWDKSYWSNLARAYAALGPPLVPSDNDIALLESAVAELASRHPARRIYAALLGVTPRIAGMNWPRDTRLIAADNSLPMAQMVWPGNIKRTRAAVCANWCALPLRDSSCDVVIGDGSLCCLRYPHDYEALAHEAHRVLRKDGILILRCYTRPVVKDRPEAVVADMLRGAIPSFHWFKFRLLGALQDNTEQGVSVDAVYRFWAGLQMDEAAIIRQTGWDAEAVGMMQLYRGKDTVYSFPTMAELRSALTEYFDLTEISAESECCPILVAAARTKTVRPSRASRTAACLK